MLTLLMVLLAGFIGNIESMDDKGVVVWLKPLRFFRDDLSVRRDMDFARFNFIGVWLKASVDWKLDNSDFLWFLDYVLGILLRLCGFLSSDNFLE